MRAGDVKYLVVHCSATKANQDIGAAEIRAWHKTQGWSDIGYHLVIRRDGTVEQGRPWHVPGAHVRGYNDCSLGICLVGGIDLRGAPEANFSERQYEALRDQLNMLLASHPGAQILGHRDFPHVAKACPCFDVRSWWRGE